jgi:tetratricopeptide (TPR) repeat protein
MENISTRDKRRSLLFVFCMTALTIGALLFLSFMDMAGGARIVMFLASAIVTVGAMVAIGVGARQEDGELIRGERLAVYALVAGLGAALFAVNGDRFFRSEGDLGRSPADRAHTARGQVPPGMPMPPPPSMSRLDRSREMPSGQGATPTGAPPLTDETVSQNGAAASPKNGEPPIPEALAKTLNALLKRAETAQKASKLDEAEALLAQIVERMDKEIPDNLTTRGQVVGNLAKVRFSAGKTDGAVAVVDDHIAKLKADDRADPLLVAAFHDLLGTFLGNSGELEAAISRFNEELTLKSEAKATPADIATTHAKIAISYARLNQKDEAKNALGKARALLSTDKPEEKEGLEKLDAIAAEYGL